MQNSSILAKKLYWNVVYLIPAILGTRKVSTPTATGFRYPKIERITQTHCFP